MGPKILFFIRLDQVLRDNNAELESARRDRQGQTGHVGIPVWHEPEVIRTTLQAKLHGTKTFRLPT